MHSHCIVALIIASQIFLQFITSVKRKSLFAPVLSISSMIVDLHCFIVEALEEWKKRKLEKRSTDIAPGRGTNHIKKINLSDAHFLLLLKRIRIIL